jgi:hypothetical protein
MNHTKFSSLLNLYQDHRKFNGLEIEFFFCPPTRRANLLLNKSSGFLHGKRKVQISLENIFKVFFLILTNSLLTFVKITSNII